jgi:peroxiredoxin
MHLPKGQLHSTKRWFALPLVARGQSQSGWVLFLILFVWQHPHFYAIAWMFKDDYARGGFKMLPVVDPDGRSSFRQSWAAALILIPVSLCPTFLKLTGWLNGEQTTEDLKGKIVVVDFWATWCGPCIASIPHNNELYAKYKDKGVVLIGACGSANGQETMEEVAKNKGIKYPVGKDSSLESAPAWRVMWWPTYGVVDRKGVLRALGLKPNAVDKAVEKLLAE